MARVRNDKGEAVQLHVDAQVLDIRQDEQPPPLSDFNVKRGINPRLSDSGAVGAPPGAHTLSPSVAFLLESCTVAGFAEVLNVHATATDGWSTQTQYNASDVRAFVLAPPEAS